MLNRVYLLSNKIEILRETKMSVRSWDVPMEKRWGHWMEPPVQMGLGVAGGGVRKIPRLLVPQVNVKAIFLKHKKFISGQ